MVLQHLWSESYRTMANVVASSANVFTTTADENFGIWSVGKLRKGFKGGVWRKFDFFSWRFHLRRSILPGYVFRMFWSRHFHRIPFSINLSGNSFPIRMGGCSNFPFGNDSRIDARRIGTRCTQHYQVYILENAVVYLSLSYFMEPPSFSLQTHECSLMGFSTPESLESIKLNEFIYFIQIRLWRYFRHSGLQYRPDHI